jgi:hypothetical protein
MVLGLCCGCWVTLLVVCVVVKVQEVCASAAPLLLAGFMCLVLFGWHTLAA